jgi:hypothetical protein
MTDNSFVENLDKTFIEDEQEFTSYELSNEEIYATLLRIRDAESKDISADPDGSCVPSPDETLTTKMLFTELSALQYIKLPKFVRLTKTEKEHLCSNDLENLPWQITENGYRFMDIYESLLKANKRISLIEEQAHSILQFLNSDYIEQKTSPDAPY